MTDDEHKQIAADFYAGKVLFGLDRMVARKFFMDLSIARIEEQTGERPSVEAFVVWSLLIVGHVTLVASWVLAYFAFGWWSTLVVPVSLVAYLIFGGHSSLPGHGLIGISLALLVSIAAAVAGVYPSAAVARYVVVLLVAFWAARGVYSAAGHFVRAFALRNKRAYEMLSSHIDIRSPGK